MNTARGRVLRDTAVGDGLLSVAGKQYPFKLEGTWKSDRAPKVDMQVDVDFDDEGRIAAIRAVDPAAAAREQAERFMSTAGATAKQWAADLKTKGAPALAELRAKSAPALAEMQAKGMPVVKRYVGLIGLPTLLAMAGVLLGWFVFAAVSIDFLGQRQSATFYDYLGVLNNPQNGLATLDGRSASAGFYGFVAIVALLAPLLPHFVKSPRLWLAYCAPAAWMVLAGVIGWWKVRSAMSEATSSAGSFGGGFGGGNELQELASGMAREFVNELWNAISIGFGAYLAAAAAIYLAWAGVRRYRTPATGAAVSAAAVGGQS
jgi:hypothetical protein